VRKRENGAASWSVKWCPQSRALQMMQAPDQLPLLKQEEGPFKDSKMPSSCIIIMQSMALYTFKKYAITLRSYRI